MIESKAYIALETHAVLPNGNGGLKPCPNLPTEEELIRLLRIPDIGKAQNDHNMITHLQRY
jgi:hypothetical protein